MAASGASVMGQIASIATAGAGKDSLATLGWDAFLPYVNTDFTFGEGLNAVVLRLVDIKDSRPFGSKARRTGRRILS